MDRFLSATGAPAAFGPLAALDAGALSRLDGRCNLDGFALYHAPDDWRKLNVHSCALRRTEYLAAGGFRTHYGVFSEMLLADALWRRGVRPVRADVPAVAHLFSGSPPDVKAYQRDVVAGELRYHREHPRGPHIGHTFVADGDPPWGEHELAWAALRALWGERRRLGTGRARRQAWRVLKLAAREGRAGRLLDHLKIHLAAGACRLIGSRPPLARRLFLAMWATAARLARKEYLATELPHECRAPRAVEFTVDELPARDLWGFHLPERWNGLPVRWTGPCAVVRLPRPVGPCEIALQTNGVGWSLAGRGLAVYADGRRVADADVIVETEVVRVRLPALEGAGPLVLATACAPPDCDDPRELGFPLFAVALRACAAPALPVAA
ncbi:MAG: hypothetical protein FJ304_17720 [Planctomycetes bacterium]|nr:hypothetical protein [Planctomycetota bacterium]